MRVLGYLLVGLLGLYVVALAALAFYQRRLIYPGAYEEIAHDEARPASAQVVTIATADGESLHALWSPPRPGCGLVLTFHGNASFPEPHAVRFAAAPWQEAGWGYLAIAYRGYPGSTGSPSEDGLIEDARAAQRFANAQAPGAPILLHGHSLGAAIAVALSEGTSHLGLYLEAPFDSMSHLVRLAFPLVPSGLLLRDTFRSDRRIRAASAPVMIVHGEEDDIVPAKLGRLLAEAAGPRAEIAVIPGDHVSILGARDREAEAFFRARLPAGCAGEPRVLAR